jgi:hypothetical protein
MPLTALEQVGPTADPRYVIGRCPSCLTWRLIPATAPARCWACEGQPPPAAPAPLAAASPPNRPPRPKGK